MWRKLTYRRMRDSVLLGLGVFLGVYEITATPPPFDLNVAILVAALCGVTAAFHADESRS